MLEQGTSAPNFTLTADDGTEVSLSDFGSQKVVIYFYPKADTPGCTKQACAIRDVYPRIESSGTVVIGISPDLPAKLVKFRQKYDLPFILLSDPDHAVAGAYGAWGQGFWDYGAYRRRDAETAEKRLWFSNKQNEVVTKS